MKLIAISLCVLAIAVPGQPDKRPTQSQSNPAENGQTTVVFENHSKASDKEAAPKDSSPRWYTPLKRPDWWLVIIAALTGLAIAYQAREMRRATKEMEKSSKAAADNIELFISKERARLLVAIKYDEASFQFDQLKPLAPLDVVWEVVKIEISQHGPTKAFNVVGRAVSLLSTSKLPLQSRVLEAMSLPAIIEGVSSPIVEAIHIPISNADELDEIQNERLFVHMFGEITYEDVFGRTHRTPFRYMWKIEGFYMEETEGDSWTDASGWVQWGEPEDNRAT
jgi:hypothetical protein